MIKIRPLIDGWNERKHPFIWTKSPDDILAKSTVKDFNTVTLGVPAGVLTTGRNDRLDDF